MKNNNILKKKIIYRSTHRGTKEMDLLLGNFVKKYIKKFSKSELNDLKKLMEFEDDVLQNLYFNRNDHNSIYDNKVFKLFKKFKF